MRAYGAHNEEELDRKLRDKYNALRLGPLTDEEFKNLKDTEYGDAENPFSSDNERECREQGKVYVRGHYTRKGEWVRGYCRNRRK